MCLFLEKEATQQWILGQNKSTIELETGRHRGANYHKLSNK